MGALYHVWLKLAGQFQFRVPILRYLLSRIKWFSISTSGELKMEENTLLLLAGWQQYGVSSNAHEYRINDCSVYISFQVALWINLIPFHKKKMRVHSLRKLAGLYFFTLLNSHPDVLFWSNTNLHHHFFVYFAIERRHLQSFFSKYVC